MLMGLGKVRLTPSNRLSPRLRLVRDRRGELRVDHHAVGDRGGAGGHRLALALHLDQALPAGADRVEQRVVAEARDLDADALRRPDDQLTLGHPHLDAVDGDGDGVLWYRGGATGGRGVGGDSHQA
jgi:hypothetical protein